MKKYVLILVACLLVGTCAHAEVNLPDFSLTAQSTGIISGEWGDVFFSVDMETEERADEKLDKDIYYHEADDCYGKLNREQVKKSKLPCPICTDVEFKTKITAVERAGTIVVRIPESWMKAQTGFKEGFFSNGAREYTWENGQRNLSDRLHGEAYCDFLEDWAEKGKARETTWSADIQSSDDLLIMHSRYMQNAIYFVLRPKDKADDELRVNLSLYKGSIEAEGDIMRVNASEKEWNNKKFKLRLTQDKSKAVFQQEYDGFKVSLYETMGVYAVVVYQYGASETDLFYMSLLIGDRDAIVLDGYMSGDKGVYCGVLTTGEAQIIMDGGEVAIKNAPLF